LEEAEAEAEAVRTAAALTAARRQLEASLREARGRASEEARARESVVAQLSDAVGRAEAAETAVRASTHARAAADAQLCQCSQALQLVKQQLRVAQHEKDELRMALQAACTERSRGAARAELALGDCAAARAARDDAAQQLAAAEARAKALRSQCDAAVRVAARPPSADASTEPVRELVLAEQSAGATIEVLMHEVRVLRLQRDQQEQEQLRLGLQRQDTRRGGQRGWAGRESLGGRGAQSWHFDDEEEEADERVGFVRRRESAQAARRLTVTDAMVRWYQAAEARRRTRLGAATVVQARARGCVARRATGARGGAF
jgi:hypothetical protein